MATNIDGVSSLFIDLYYDLTKEEQLIAKRESKLLNESVYEYLEEVFVDYKYARMISYDIIKRGIISGLEIGELTDLLLLFGIGVVRRRPEEISLITGETINKIEDYKEYLKVNFSETIDTIYDEVMKYIESDKNAKEVVK